MTDPLAPALRWSHPHGQLVALKTPSDATLALEENRLLPDERAVLAELGPFRRRSWMAGRLALIEALEAIGAPRTALLSTARGAPAVPRGVSGSISHKPEIAVALAARTGEEAVGVDVETIDRPRPAIAPRVLTPAELEEIAGWGPDETWLAIVARFAIKEAIYKAIDPFVQRYVAFQEAELLGLKLPEPSPLSAPIFHPMRATMTLSGGEGPFAIETTWCLSEVILATARIRPLDAGRGPALNSL